jgi:iron complex outermembrane recepter protein
MSAKAGKASGRFPMGFFRPITSKERKMTIPTKLAAITPQGVRLRSSLLRLTWAVLFLVGIPALGLAQEAAKALGEMSIEELMQVEVTSVSRKAEPMQNAAAAVFVLTAEDLRRSGVTNLPDALRMVPGLEVAQITSNTWAITSRGFNSVWANKLLVLMDGRSVYSPWFSGVCWDLQNVMLEDVDRIEVIRGPGATMWGANAVNGIINIITKSAKDTQGGLVSEGVGKEDRSFGNVRYGGKIGDTAFYRAYAKYFDRDGTVDKFGKDVEDDWKMAQAGGRMDWKPSGANSLTLQGDIYKGQIGHGVNRFFLTPPFHQIVKKDESAAGGNVLLRWNHIFSSSSGLALQLYYDRMERQLMEISGSHDTYDLDFQHRFLLAKRHELMWGLGYRLVSFESQNTFNVSFHPANRVDLLYSAFAQDEITLVENRLHWTLGSKFEHNDYTGFEYQPSTRILWTPHQAHTVWAAVSRAVQTPSRTRQDMRANLAVFPAGPMPAVVAEMGRKQVESADVIAYELGYRVIPRKEFSVDIAGFYNVYHKLRTREPEASFLERHPAPAHLVFPLVDNSKGEGESYGVETAANWRVTEPWKLTLAYSFINLDLRKDPSSRDQEFKKGEGTSPHHQVKFRSDLDLPYHLEFDTSVNYVDSLADPYVPSYIRLDTRLGWRPSDSLEASICLQNALTPSHPEFGTWELVRPQAVERNIYGKITWRF